MDPKIRMEPRPKPIIEERLGQSLIVHFWNMAFPTVPQEGCDLVELDVTIQNNNCRLTYEENIFLDRNLLAQSIAEWQNKNSVVKLSEFSNQGKLIIKINLVPDVDLYKAVAQMMDPNIKLFW